MVSLLDIPSLSPLGQICQRLRIHFEMFGGCVTRLITHLKLDEPGATLTTEVLNDVDMFTLSPPFADVELSHSGHPSMTAEIRREILGAIPASECFRWDVRSRSEWSDCQRAIAYNNRIPTRLMSLSSDPVVGFVDPFDGQEDIRSGCYRYVRNAMYKRSPLYVKGKDLEFSSALLYLRGLLESPLADRQLLEQESAVAVRAVMQDARSSDTIRALDGSDHLSARVRYLLAGIAAGAAGRPRKIVDRLLSDYHVKSWLEFVQESNPVLGGELMRIAEGPDGPGRAAMSSARLDGDVYRTGWLSEGWVGADSAVEALQAVCRASDSRRRTLLGLGDGEHLVLASPEISVKRGAAPSAGAGRVKGDDSQEFIYFNIDGSKGEDAKPGDESFLTAYEDEEIAVLMAVSVGNGWAVYPLPGRVRQHPRTTRVLVSLNAFGLLQRLEGNSMIRLFLSGWKGAQ